MHFTHLLTVHSWANGLYVLDLCNVLKLLHKILILFYFFHSMDNIDNLCWKKVDIKVAL